MKTLLITLTLLLTVQLSAQSPIFQQKMGEALGNFSAAKTAADYINTSYQFQQIANVEKDNWLPEYYVAMCYTMASYGVKTDNPKQKDAYIDIAEEHIATLKTLAVEEAEIYALEALVYTARLSVNPMERGQKYSMLSSKSVGIALGLDPTNPRAQQLKIANAFGTAQFFGSDTKSLCQEAKVLLAKWDDYPVKSPFHPTWGKGHLTAMAKSCDSDTAEKTTPSEAAILTIEMNDFTSDEGVVLIQIKDENEVVVQSISANIENKKASTTVKNLAPGNYSISYFHDANANMKMDRDKYGRPLEGYGFSNNAKAMMKAPDFKDTIFAFDKNLTLSLKTRN